MNCFAGSFGREDSLGFGIGGARQALPSVLAGVAGIAFGAGLGCASVAASALDQELE